MPDYKKLLASVGVAFEQLKLNQASLGAKLDASFKIISNPFKDSAAYKAGLEKDDTILSVNGIAIEGSTTDFLAQFKPNQTVKVVFKRFNTEKQTQLTFDRDVSYTTELLDKTTKKTLSRREKWLKI